MKNIQQDKQVTSGDNAATASVRTVVRVSSRELMGAACELEIDHEGRIYRLRLTQHNKLILTA